MLSRITQGNINLGSRDRVIIALVAVAILATDMQNTYANSRNDFKTPPPVERHEDIEIDR